MYAGVRGNFGGTVVNDASWMRKADECTHINVAELEAVLKDLNLALRWHLCDIVVNTDFLSVYSWDKSVITNSHQPKVNGMSEMSVKRRLGVIA